MNYNDIYNNMFFNNPAYSNEDHIQYHYVIDNISKLNLSNNNIIEIGSGRGQNLNYILKGNIKNLKLTSVDLNKYHNYPVDRFIYCNLSIDSDRKMLYDNSYNILVCTDVFEHLDKSYIEDVISLCSDISEYAILAIANHSDMFDGIELHTIQENDSWWENLLNKKFVILDKKIHYNNRLYLYICKKRK